MATAGEAFQRLVEIMKRLRGPGGCPWDHEQTIQSLRQSTVAIDGLNQAATSMHGGVSRFKLAAA